jgi:enoyl-CoA hydratase/carnithine racemase
MAQELASGKLTLDEPAADVARLTIRNEDKRGALDLEMLAAIAETVPGIEARCLILTGSGRMFSSGYDIGNFEDDEQFSIDAEQLVAHPFSNAIEALEAFPYPILAAINGHAIGGGLEVALTADIRLVARGAKMGMPPAKISLIYSHTGLRKFLETIGPAHTAELFHVGENIDSDRAARIGLVNHVVDDEEELEERSLGMAGVIAANAPLSLAGNKRVIRSLLEAGARLDPELERELVELRETCFRSEDFREGIAAFAEKRKPQWKGR